MNIAVLVKQTFDTEAVIELDANGKISSERIKPVLNPFDEFAVEEGIRLQEAHGGEVCVICLDSGLGEAEDMLRQTLAMGADEAILLTDTPPGAKDDAGVRAKILAVCLKERKFDILLSGWVSVDSGEAQTAVRLAELLDIPQATIVTALNVTDGKAVARRETDNGSEVLDLPLPALITVQKGINEPRYPGFKGIMQARKKPLTTISCSDLLPQGLPAPKLSIEKCEIPARAAGQILGGDLDDVCRDLVLKLQPLL